MAEILGWFDENNRVCCSTCSNYLFFGGGDYEMKKQLSWADFDDLCYRLAHNIQMSGYKPRSIQGIARGGLVVAVRLSHIFGIPYSPYIGELIVDDICDSGATLKAAQKPGCKTACLHTNPNSKIQPDFYVEEKRVAWIVYPWEV